MQSSIPEVTALKRNRSPLLNFMEKMHVNRELSPQIAYWHGGWPRKEFASFNFIIPGGTSMADYLEE